MSGWLGVLPCRIGQIFITGEGDGKVALCHRDDVERSDLTIYQGPDFAAELARYDDTDAYRPLKTAPNLRHGWQLVLADLSQARLAVDYFYPGRGAAFRAWENRDLRTTPLRETLGRQSGIYRVAAKISDGEADEVVGNFCRSDGGCLRTILWKRDVAGAIASNLLPASKFDPNFDQTGRGENARPLLCQEACNLVVAELRSAVKPTESRET